MTAGLRMDLLWIVKKKRFKILLEPKVSFFKKYHICPSPTYQIKMVYSENILKIKQISEGKVVFK